MTGSVVKFLGSAGAALALTLAFDAPNASAAEAAKVAAQAPVQVASAAKPAAAPAPAKPAAEAAKVASAEAAGDPSQMAKGPKISRETFGEWELECFTPKQNGLSCQVVQRLIAKDSNQLVLVMSVAYSASAGKHMMQIALPLNFMLKPGVEIAIGDAKTVAHVDRCSGEGCFVEGIAGDDLVAALNKSDKADIKFLANPEKRLVIPFSLKGFSDAYAKMKQMNSAS